MSDLCIPPLENQATRLAKVRRFLSKPPTHAAWLMLFAVGNPPMKLQEWIAPIVPALAEEVEARLVEHAVDVEQREQKYSLTYCDADKQVIGSTTITFRQASEVQPAEQVAMGIDGTTTGALIQMQRFVENIIRPVFTQQQQNMHMAKELAEQAIAQSAQTSKTNELLAARCLELEKRNAELAGTYQASDTGPEEATEIQKQMMALVTTHAPDFVRMLQLMAVKFAAAPPATNATTATAAAAAAAAAPKMG